MRVAFRSHGGGLWVAIPSQADGFPVACRSHVVALSAVSGAPGWGAFASPWRSAGFQTGLERAGGLADTLQQ